MAELPLKVITRAADLARVYGCAFVPTMGALHRGHGALIDAAKRSGLRVVVSIFVNPTQFGPGEDFDRYPRVLDADLEFCRQRGVHAVFAPSAEEIYPKGFCTQVTVRGLEDVMCGVHRPGHFAGVTTVVARLFRLVRPAEAYFGWKDAQQYLLIRRATEDLALDVTVHPVETVREPDGLALSSRNAYLSPEERALASELYRALKKGEAAAREGARSAEVVVRARRHLASMKLQQDYVELRRIADLSEVMHEKPLTPALARREAVAAAGTGAPVGYLLAAAIRIGTTRLIDNLRFFADF